MQSALRGYPRSAFGTTKEVIDHESQRAKAIVNVNLV